jgi:hypothetical protein
VDYCTEGFANYIVTGDITFTWFILPIGIQYQGLHTFCGRGEMSETPKKCGCGRDSLTLLLVGNLNRRLLAFQQPFNFSFFHWRMKCSFEIYPRSSKYQDEGTAGGCYGHCVLGSETITSAMESSNVAVHGYNGTLE